MWLASKFVCSNLVLVVCEVVVKVVLVVCTSMLSCSFVSACSARVYRDSFLF